MHAEHADSSEVNDLPGAAKAPSARQGYPGRWVFREPGDQRRDSGLRPAFFLIFASCAW